MIQDPIIYIVVGVYCILMVAVGVAVSKLNKNEDDYLRGGAKASWWLVGISIFMSGLISLLAVLPESFAHRMICLWLGIMVLVVGAVFFVLGQRSYKRLKPAAAKRGTEKDEAVAA